MTRIVAGWYFRHCKELGTKEVIFEYEGSCMFELSTEVVKVLVAQDIGHQYIKEIDFEYFDRSESD